jgi:hypothetical protein
MGAYLNRTKVGFSYLDLSPAAPDRSLELKGLTLPAGSETIRPAWQLYSESEIEVMAYNRRKPLSWKMLAGLQPDFSLTTFRFEMKSDDSLIEMAGQVNGQEVILTIHSSGDERIERIPFQGNSVFLAEGLASHYAWKWRHGQAIDGEYAVFEPQQIAATRWKTCMEDAEVLQLAGKSVETRRVRQDMGGLATVTWMDKEGAVVKEWAPLGEKVGYLSFAESEQQAKDRGYIHPSVLASPLPGEDASEPDLMYSTAVKSGREIPQPSRVSRMVVDLWDFKLDRPVPSGGNQRILSAPANGLYTADAPLRLEITVSTPPLPETSNPENSGQPVEKRYLEPEPFVQSDHPEIQDLAKSMTQGMEGSWEKALALHRWIGANIQVEFRITLPSAIEVLHTRKGDCNEQSALFAALARAAGVPVRICTGLVHQRGAFYYHAWDEVLAGASPGQWIPIDPVLRQTLADATHIKLGEGGLADQTYITGLIGKIRANILEVETNDPDSRPDPPLRANSGG